MTIARIRERVDRELTEPLIDRMREALEINQRARSGRAVFYARPGSLSWDEWAGCLHAVTIMPKHIKPISRPKPKPRPRPKPK